MDISQLTQTEDSAPDQFPELWYDIVTEDHFWFYWRFKALLSVIKKLNINLYAQHSSFDIGSGNALLISQLESVSAWTVDGCDISPKFVGKIKLRGSYFQYNIFEKREELKEKYDFIFLFDILEHLKDPKTFLEASSFYLKKGGFIFIDVPAFQSLYGNYDKAGGHKMRYNRNTVNQWLGSGAFVVEDFRYWGMALTPLVLLRKIFTHFSNDDVKILTQGMRPPNKMFNSLLRLGAEVETSITSKPPFGCSLLLTLRKK